MSKLLKGLGYIFRIELLLIVWQVYQNVQVVKTQKFECQFSHALCFVLVLDNLQFIREKDELKETITEIIKINKKQKI